MKTEGKSTPMRIARRERGISLRELAGLTGISIAELSRAERSLSDLSGLRKVQVSRALGVAVDRLFPINGGRNE